MGRIFQLKRIMLFLLSCLFLFASANLQITRLDKSVAIAPESEFECKVCLSFMDDALNDLIQIIANVGIGGGCSKVCGLLPSKTLAEVCDIVCEIAGIEEFGKLLQEADPDPIYLCEKVNLCAHSTTAAANITDLTISPTSGTQGTKFSITPAYTVTNEIATGELVVVVVPPDASSFGDGQTIFTQASGSYGGNLSFEAKPSEQEPFDPGQYQVVAAVCEGTCGSIHEWSATLSEKSTSFEIKQQ